MRPETAVRRGAPAGTTISHDSPVERGFNRPISPERHTSSAALAPYRADGKVWLDEVQTFIPMGVPGSPKLIVYRRVDATGLLHP